MVNSIPKAGTNLVEKLVRLAGFRKSGKSIAFSSVEGRYAVLKGLLRKPGRSGTPVAIGLEVPVDASLAWLERYVSAVRDGTYLSGHAAFSEQLDGLLQDQQIAVIQVYRDPRAILASWADYSVAKAMNWYPFQEFLKSMDVAERIRFFLHGGQVTAELHYASFPVVIERTRGWLESPKVLAVRYEDLVGARGGGDDSIQRSSIASVLAFVGRSVDQKTITNIQDRLYSGTPTFRKGQVSSWREVIDERLEAEIMAACDLPPMRRLGYCA